jgi:hypothetical protein
LSSPDAQRLAAAPRPPHCSPAAALQTTQQPQESSAEPVAHPSTGSGSQTVSSQVPQLRETRLADTMDSDTTTA